MFCHFLYETIHDNGEFKRNLKDNWNKSLSSLHHFSHHLRIYEVLFGGVCTCLAIIDACGGCRRFESRVLRRCCCINNTNPGEPNMERDSCKMWCRKFLGLEKEYGCGVTGDNYQRYCCGCRSNGEDFEHFCCLRLITVLVGQYSMIVAASFVKERCENAVCDCDDAGAVGCILCFADYIFCGILCLEGIMC
jgi:hypothetical protein